MEHLPKENLPADEEEVEEVKRGEEAEAGKDIIEPLGELRKFHHASSTGLTAGPPLVLG